MKENLPHICKLFPFKREGFITYSLIVTILLTVVILAGIGGNYQIESVEAQSANASSISESIEKGNSLFALGKYEEAITWYDKV